MNEKTAVRERALSARSRLTAEERLDLSRRIAARVVALDSFARARSLALYAPLGAEVDPSAIHEAALASGRRVAFPIVREGTRVLAYATCGESELVAGPHRTRQPPDGAPAVPLGGIDLLFVPGVAFDERCRRLGRGGGYYDATLAALGPRTVSVGLAFEAQMVTELPCDAHDRPVDVVVTDHRVIFRPMEAPGP